MASTIRPRQGPSPSSMAGLSLRRMHRNVRIGRAGLWAAVASGPVALAVALMPAPAVVPAAVAQPAPRTVAQPSQDPSGYAELFVSSWLRSSAHDEESAQSRRA